MGNSRLYNRRVVGPSKSPQTTFRFRPNASRNPCTEQYRSAQPSVAAAVAVVVVDVVVDVVVAVCCFALVLLVGVGGDDETETSHAAGLGKRVPDFFRLVKSELFRWVL
jgi:hypothetical protein